MLQIVIRPKAVDKIGYSCLLFIYIFHIRNAHQLFTSINNFCVLFGRIHQLHKNNQATFPCHCWYSTLLIHLNVLMPLWKECLNSLLRYWNSIIKGHCCCYRKYLQCNKYIWKNSANLKFNIWQKVCFSTIAAILNFSSEILLSKSTSLSMSIET